MLADFLSSPIVLTGLALWTIVAVALAVRVAGRVSAIDVGDDGDSVRRIARNSLIPIASQFVIRGSDLAVAIVLLRLLGPEGNGRYAIAVVVWLYVKTLSDFGLSLLATADIARDRTSAGRVIGATTLLRLLVLGLSATPVGLYLTVGLTGDSLSVESVLAILLLYLSIIPSSYAEAVNSALNGIERMEIGAWLNVAVSFARAPLAVILASLLGVEGVALAALVTALLSAELYRRAAVRAGIGRIVWSLGGAQARTLVARSWPLLVNALLVNLFFRVDVFILQAIKGDEALGVYDASYKLVNLVTIIPAYVTLAIFPTMAQRSDDPAALDRALRMASYFLVWIAWGVVACATALAGGAIRVVAGGDYLPEAAILLRVLIWFAPFAFLNGVIQYALIASEQQRRILPAFVAAVSFNLALNVVFIPAYGARAAAAATVATEVVILIAFAAVTRHSRVRAVTWDSLRRLWKPTLAGVVASAIAAVLVNRQGETVATVAAVLAFASLSLALRVFGAVERDILRRAVRRSPARA
ncbi:MAG: oligosaccharide flippase family protein [Thermomicrobiales bacterium]